MRFKKSFFAVVLVISVINAVPAIADDSQAARQAAVNRYLKIVPMRKMLEDSYTEIAKQIPKEKQEQFLSDMRSIVDADKIEGIARRAMVKTFTVDELNALSDFYGSKNGASAMRKFGPYMGEVMPPLMQEIQRAITQLQARKTN
jgi:hypothetical protein